MSKPSKLARLLSKSSIEGKASRPEQSELGPKVLTEVQDPRVDIVFLHGLTGHRDKTWTAAGETELWPKALLSKDLPMARIITYGYDADVVNLTTAAGQNTVREHARNLINDLVSLRNHNTGTPLIFVVHSLGGLVCQDALLVCRNPNEEAQSDILESTRGIAFLGTPHAGSDLEKFASAVANIVSLVKKPNRRILQVLNRNSQILANIKNDFHTMVQARLRNSQTNNLQPIQLHAFIEEMPLHYLQRRVVEPDSAKIPGYNSDTIPANHMEMTKFTTSSDLGYQRILNRLKRWIGDDLLVDDGLDSEFFTNMINRLPGIKYANSELHDSVQQLLNLPDTTESLEWFTDSSEYKAWKRMSTARLWLCGEPRDGKTVAMSYAIRDLAKQTELQDIASIFCSSGDSEIDLVACLVLQLLKSRHRVHTIRQNILVSEFKQASSTYNSKILLWKLLETMIVQKEGFKTVFIIDGIDKLDFSTSDSFLDKFSKFENNTDLKVLISSENKV